MLYITERKTEQHDLIAGTVLNMISLFVVAYPDEVAKCQEDNFVSFLKHARSEGRMVWAGPEDEVVEVKLTRRGFLIKCYYISRIVTDATAPF